MRPARSDCEPCRTGLDEPDEVTETGQPDGPDQTDVAGADDRDGTGWVRHGRAYQPGIGPV